MTKKITHSFTLPDGKTVTRISASRRYPFVIICLDKYTAEYKADDVAAAEKALAKATATLNDPKRPAYYAQRVADFPAWRLKHQDDPTPAGITELFRGYDVSAVEDRTRSLERIQATPLNIEGTWGVCGWSGTAGNANKAADKFAGYRRGRVCRVCEVTDITERDVKKAGPARTAGKLTKAQKALLAHVTTNTEAGACLWRDSNGDRLDKIHSDRVAKVLVARNLIETRYHKRFNDDGRCVEQGNRYHLATK